ncbi:hypothetical protein ES703_79836 [subsurface metagenome]
MVLLPSKEYLAQVIDSLEMLINLCNEKNVNELYPSHEEFNISKDILTDLSNHLKNIDDIWENRKPNEVNNAWTIEIDRFVLLINVGIKEREDFRKRLRLLK